MSGFEVARAARRALDARLANVDGDAFAPPRRGWIHAVRSAVGMSAAELGCRMSVSRQAVAAMEASEGAGTVRLETLQRAAEALDCRLVYALVPNTSLQSTVEAEAGRIVDALAASVAHTMALEAIVVDPRPTDRADAIEDLIRAGQIWSDRTDY